MKTLTLIAGVMLIAAAPLHAYVQTGNLVNTTRSATQEVVTELPLPVNVAPIRPGTTPLPASEVADETTTQPVPEPGTMAMASMGLLALGAAIRRKRAR